LESVARELVRQYHTRVYRYFLGHVGDGSAEELTQEVFLRVVKGLRTYESRGRDAAWVFTIARRVLADFWRSGSRERMHVESPDEDRLPLIVAPQFSNLSLREALEQLPESQRDAFLLREVGGLDYGEIAAAQDNTIAGVRSLIYRARLVLRAYLKESLEKRGEKYVRRQTIRK
jgi:RNA polymerase sigma-70 factor (ECF subfamily)